MISLILAGIIAAQAEFSLSPMSIDLVVSPGARKEFDFVVYNESKSEPLTIFLYPQDIIQTTDAVYQTVEIGKGVPSCADWITLNDSVIDIAPNTAKAVIGQIKVPRIVKGGRYGAVVVETKPTRELIYKTKTAVIIHVVIRPPTKPKALITNIKFQDPESVNQLRMMGKFKDQVAISASVKNEGDIHFYAKGRLIIKDKQGRRICEYPLATGPGLILPNTTVDMMSVIKKPTLGEYLADVIVSYGARSPARAQVPFEVAYRQVAGKKGFVANAPLAITPMPENIELKILPNVFRSRTIVMHNEETTSVKVAAEINEMQSDINGEILASEDSLYQGWSCAKWITLEPNEFTIRPNERKTLKINIQIPNANIQGEKYAQVVFNIRKDNSMPSVLTVPVYLTYQSEKREELKLEDIKISSVHPYIFNTSLRNTGNVRLKPSGKIIVQSNKSPEMIGDNLVTIGEYALKEIKDFVLPDRNVYLQAEGPYRLPKGKYKLKAEIQYGKGKYLFYDRDVNI